MARYRATAASRGRQVLIPRDLKRVPGGLWTYGACRRYVLAANQITGWAAGHHVALVPSHPLAWQPPIAATEWRAWLETTERLIGRLESWVVQLPADASGRRFSLSLLDRTGTPPGHATFATARLRQLSIKAQELLTAEPPTPSTPKLLGFGHLAEWSYTLTSPIPQLCHRAASLHATQRRSITGEILRRLAALNASHGAHVVIHGDLGPWNVRRLTDGRIAVIDWEDVRLGPPVADELWHSFHSSLLQHRNGKKAALQCRRELRITTRDP